MRWDKWSIRSVGVALIALYCIGKGVWEKYLKPPTPWETYQQEEKARVKNSHWQTHTNTVSQSQATTVDVSIRCKLCQKEVENLSLENLYYGHHLKIGGLKTSDVVCGLPCDIQLRNRIVKQVDREIESQRLRDPDIKMPDLEKVIR